MLSPPRAPKANAAARPLHLALRRVGGAPLVAALVAFACREEVPLGAWGQAGGVGGTSGSSGASPGGANSGGNTEPGSGAGGEGNATCARVGTPGPFNTGTAEVGPTLTATEWSWAARSDVMEVDLTVEDEPPPGGDGYFWAYQFAIGSSTQSNSGFVGLQVNGAFTNPDTNVTDYTKRLAVFWIAGPPLRGEFGDIVDPQEAYTYTATKGNTMWLAINVSYTWEKCRTYRLRVGRHSVENGDIWYGAWVTDTVTQVRTFIGRILVPGSWGQLSRTSTSWCDRIGWAPLTTCSALAHVSASWGIPRATVAATSATSMASGEDRFGWNGSPLRCPSSRFTDFSDGVRHESGVGP